jgi:hypothetical protein
MTGRNRTKTGERRNLALCFTHAFGVFAVIAALLAHDLKPAPDTAGLDRASGTSRVEPGNDECRGYLFAIHHFITILFPRRLSAPGVCNAASLTPNRGVWVERRETFGCSSEYP